VTKREGRTRERENCDIAICCGVPVRRHFDLMKIHINTPESLYSAILDVLTLDATFESPPLPLFEGRTLLRVQ
jgi:hypothetical protein